MTNDWIIHVIADLEEFATSNDLPALAVQLRRAHSTAQSELSLAKPPVAEEVEQEHHSH